MTKFEIVIPAEHKPVFESCLSEVQKHPVKWAYALHPVDEMSSFEHYHLGVSMSTSYSIEQVFEWFKAVPADGDFSIQRNSIEKIKSHFNTYMTYLKHETKDAKAQGKSAPVEFGCSDGLSFEDALKSYDKSIVADTLIDGILNGSVRECDFYSDDDLVKSIIKAHKMRDVQDAFNAYYKGYLLKGDDVMRSDRKQIWIYGEPGCGKSSLAKYLCKAEGFKDLDIYITSSGSNPFDDYKGQRCVIVDDIDADTMTPKTALKLLDLFMNSAVSARYSNKVICADRIFITSTISPSEWWKNLALNTDGSVYQLLRRLNGGCMHITGKSFTCEAFNMSTGESVGSMVLEMPAQIQDYISNASKPPAFDFVSAHFKVKDVPVADVRVDKDGSITGHINDFKQLGIDDIPFD